MRSLASLAVGALVVSLLGCVTDKGNADPMSDYKAQCAGFGFTEGTDTFANCMMQLSLRQKRQRPPPITIRWFANIGTAAWLGVATIAIQYAMLQ
ncbi:hypothetical protein ACETRX_21615 [Labrys portucalensis]|uniref:Lipoprotein n=1 Tax=Labrys neptuniae TaxID=376174 RepID=A0ABV6ZJ90_9HYPH